MPRHLVLALFFLAIFLQSGTYGLTFMLPKLFAGFGANEKDVGTMLIITAVTTLLTVWYSGHLSDRFGRMMTLAISSLAVAASLYLYAHTTEIGWAVIIASVLMGFGWGLLYTLGPVVLTRISLPEYRVRIFSMFSVFMMAGFGLSPVLASALESYGFTVQSAFSTVAVCCLISGAIFFLLRAPVAALSIAPVNEDRSQLSLVAAKAIFKSPAWLPIIMVLIGASVFAGLNNFQTVMAQAEGQNYRDFFLAYTITVIVCRLLLVGFNGGKSPYKTIALLQYVMCASILIFMFTDGSRFVYILSAILFGIGYGASYPILAAMASNDARDDLVPQTMQLFALSYFIGIFGFPFIAGWLIVDFNIPTLLIFIAALAALEATMALMRHRNRTKHK